MADPFLFMNSINYDKIDLLQEDPLLIRDYNPFLTNRTLSYHVDAILFANEMNMKSFLPKENQYYYYLHALNKKRRFSKWSKKSAIDNLELIKQIYSVSDSKAIQILKVLTKEQIEQLTNLSRIGGMKK